MLLALTLLDDSVWPWFMKRNISGDDLYRSRLGFSGSGSRETSDSELSRTNLRSMPRLRTFLTGRGIPPPLLASPSRIRSVVVLPLFVLALLLGIAQLKTACDPPEHPQASLASKINIAQFFLVNDYGLFRRMTETRPEIVIEGSGDGTSWKPYGFHWKPGDLAQRPRLAAPHQPRLDWQMWFEALRLEQVHEITGTIDPSQMSPWFQALLNRLLGQQPDILKLLGENPFPDRPPKFIRIALYEYRFTSTQEARKTGNWWHRDLVWLGPGWSLAE